MQDFLLAERISPAMRFEPKRRELYTKIERWRSWSALNEEATIQGLVLPVLETSGYNTRNPEEVLPQARDTQGNKPDLMLYKTSPLEQGVEWCVIEAKALGKPLNNFVSQVGQYLIASNAQWYVLTDGYEWRFFDKNHPQNNFHRITITLDTPGALDALSCLLDKARPAPDLDCAFQTLIEARLREAARQVEWEKHCTAWELTEQLVTPLSKAVAEMSKQSDHEQFIGQWIDRFKEHLQSQNPPVWWAEDKETDALLTATGVDEKGSRISLQQLADDGFQVKFFYPAALWIGGRPITLNIKSWLGVLRAVIVELDSRGCLPPPPYHPFGNNYKLYSDTTTSLHKPVELPSRHFTKLYANSQGLDAPRAARALLQLVKDAQCPQITPSDIQLELHHWGK
ncbi:MAG: type I restriction enzyme HsdR N-terminal domain-containing protein [Fimbriimonadales bacterium]|nr:type I restriction enzyme HsdR N-terminal domain-containing protein [Fimbriimonadales bacterium]